jgi:hypothetical protein
MSERGVFALDRGWFDHPAFAREPFTEREAWAWLISEAAWKPHKRRADGKVIEIGRGQLCHALRFMADAWGWSKSRVDRFLDRLEKQDMIERQSGTRTPVITLCNYDKFQRVSLPERDNTGTTSGTTAGQQRDKLESIKNKEIPQKTTSSSGPRRATAFPEDFEPNQADKDCAIQCGISLEALPAVVAHWRDHHTAKGNTFKDWHASLRTWLRSPLQKPAAINGAARPPPGPPKTEEEKRAALREFQMKTYGFTNLDEDHEHPRH